MGAIVEYTFKKGFLLDEEKIRKINDLLIKRICTENSHLPFEYKVYRNDDYTYTTSNINNILAEENSSWKKITCIEVVSLPNEQLKFTLYFDETTGNRLELEGDNRDIVYLLYADLKDYLKNEVNICRIAASKDFRRIASTMLPLIFLLVFLGYIFMKASPPEAEIENALQSSNIEEKINYLISRTSIGPPGKYSFILIMLMVVSLLLFGVYDVTGRFMNALFPSNLFLIGKEKERYLKRKTISNKLIWGIIVTLVISIIGGLIVLRIAR